MAADPELGLSSGTVDAWLIDPETGQCHLWEGVRGPITYSCEPATGRAWYGGVRTSVAAQFPMLAAGVCDDAAPPPPPPPDCGEYLATTGCSWTISWSCPLDAHQGTEGVAGDDGSLGFHCCCEAPFTPPPLPSLPPPPPYLPPDHLTLQSDGNLIWASSGASSYSFLSAAATCGSECFLQFFTDCAEYNECYGKKVCEASGALLGVGRRVPEYKWAAHNFAKDDILLFSPISPQTPPPPPSPPQASQPESDKPFIDCDGPISFTIRSDDPDLCCCADGKSTVRVLYTGTPCETGTNKIQWTSAVAYRDDIAFEFSAEQCAWSWFYTEGFAEPKYAGGCGIQPTISGGDQLPTTCRRLGQESEPPSTSCQFQHTPGAGRAHDHYEIMAPFPHLPPSPSTPPPPIWLQVLPQGTANCEAVTGCSTITSAQSCFEWVQQQGIGSQIGSPALDRSTSQPGCVLYQPQDLVEFNDFLTATGAWTDISPICVCDPPDSPAPGPPPGPLPPPRPPAIPNEQPLCSGPIEWTIRTSHADMGCCAEGKRTVRVLYTGVPCEGPQDPQPSPGPNPGPQDPHQDLIPHKILWTSAVAHVKRQGEVSQRGRRSARACIPPRPSPSWWPAAALPRVGQL